jgi:MFS family permease
VALRAIEDGRSPSAPRGSYDAAGAAASASGLLLLVFVITQLAHRTVSPAAVLVAALLAVGLLAGFAVHERRTEAPLLPLSLFRLGTLRAADLASLTVLAAPFGFSYVSTLYYQDVQGHSPLATGLALLPGAVLSAFVSRYVAPALVARVGLRTAAVGGMALVSAGFAGLLGIAADASYLTTLLPTSIVCLGLGMGISYPVFTIGAVTGVEDEEQGVAAGIQNTALQVGGGLGLAIVAGAVAARLGDARDTHALVDALRVGAAVGALLPLLGAVVALVGLRSQRRGGHAS